MARKEYVNNAPEVRHAQMNDTLVESLDTQLARIALKKTASIVCKFSREDTP